MNYLSFTLRDPDSQVVRCVGVKYKKTDFQEKDLSRIQKNGTANFEVKEWIKLLKSQGKLPEVEVLYRGTDSAEACWHKQQYIINHKEHDLIGINISSKKYTKKIRVNEEMRRPIKDQHGVVYPGVLEAAETLYLAASNISKVLHGKLDHIGGYRFTFCD